jgi:xylose dehydrogenase (NAD/NADP)
LRIVKMDFSFDIDRRDWRLDPRRGGGALYDLGCYGINAARFFSGAEPVDVLARSRRYETGVDMTTSILLRFPGDTLALVDCSFECQYRKRIELVGTRGSLEFPGGALPPPDSELIFRHGEAVETIPFTGSNPYAGQIECFCESVAAGRLLEPAENGLANMKVLDAARRAAERAINR